MCRAPSRLPGVRRRCIHSDKRLAPFSAPPTSLLSWGPANVVHPWKWHIKEWSAKAFRHKSLAQGCSLLNKMETRRREVHLLSVLAETQALTLGMMCLIIYMGLSANNAWFPHWSTLCHLWKSWKEAPMVFPLLLFFFILPRHQRCCLKKPCPLTGTGRLTAAGPPRPGAAASCSANISLGGKKPGKSATFLQVA